MQNMRATVCRVCFSQTVGAAICTQNSANFALSPWQTRLALPRPDCKAEGISVCCRIARGIIEERKTYSKSKVANDVLNATRLNLLGLGATIVALQAGFHTTCLIHHLDQTADLPSSPIVI